MSGMACPRIYCLAWAFKLGLALAISHSPASHVCRCKFKICKFERCLCVLDTVQMRRCTHSTVHISCHTFCRDIVPCVAVRRFAGDHPVLARGPRLPQAAPVHLPGRVGQRLRKEHQEGSRGQTLSLLYRESLEDGPQVV